ncbi:hypothetical protein SLEP1_g56224 [Rubroshorea leprosula]|uniref:Uncharacterized protein n=1 Tax=Rubroshorea leprosula TaxID=152421 RepID=A0AAV5MIX7_9ROSI|nr:hypothetical protein SLEP1_g56224 [Rubroshorea leprosula]
MPMPMPDPFQCHSTTGANCLSSSVWLQQLTQISHGLLFRRDFLQLNLRRKRKYGRERLGERWGIKDEELRGLCEGNYVILYTILEYRTEFLDDDCASSSTIEWLLIATHLRSWKYPLDFRINLPPTSSSFFSIIGSINFSPRNQKESVLQLILPIESALSSLSNFLSASCRKYPLINPLFIGKNRFAIAIKICCTLLF